MSKRVKIEPGSGNVFRDLGFPEHEARNLALRSELMIRIEEFVEQSDLTQARAAQRLGITQPRLNALLRGKIDQFSLDALVNAATRAGLNVELRITSARRRTERVTASA
ncbi:MAG: helix-turn-helix domain-containing protein [Steroidobacteraceae bacterium]